MDKKELHDWLVQLGYKEEEIDEELLSIAASVAQNPPAGEFFTD